MLESLRPHIRPFQKPHPPIGVAGVSAGSETLKVAGERGFLPMSLNLNQTYVASHWASVEEGARRTGRTPSRADWRLVREIFVADTDEEAWRLSVGAQMGRMMREYFLPLLKNVGVIQYLKHDEAVADSDVTPEYCAPHNWLIGSPVTVVGKIERMYEEVGGFGHLLLFCFDYSENPHAWRHSMELLAHEVMPKVAHLCRREAGSNSALPLGREVGVKGIFKARAVLASRPSPARWTPSLSPLEDGEGNLSCAEERAVMEAWWQCEIPYPFVPRQVLDAAESVRGSLPNRYCDPEIAADLFEEVIDEFLLCDDLGLNVLAIEHHAGINSLFGANPMLVGILARQTKNVRILSLGTLVSLRPDPVRIAEEYATADVISRGRLDIGFVKSGGTEMPSANVNPVRNEERYWEAIDLITKALSSHDGPFTWEGKHYTHRHVNIWPRPYQRPYPRCGRPPAI